ncbi:TonB-dependent receptor domain-containing protein [Terriglobus sp.]|uniref:TonB-dependent receptor domain-containing protein n=1 Tax=Terriglobus sp. TaxID=1889013 RepID=UPI003AFFCADD
MNIARKARALALVATAVGAPALYGQAIYGSLYGTVTDSTGAAIPNATVVVTDITKGTSDTVTTNGSGAYTVEHLIPDTYSVKVTASGFSGFQATGIVVSADTAPKIDAKLNVGDTGQTVTVSADEVPLLKTDRADVSTIFDTKNVTELPLPNRNFTGLQLLLPGSQLLGWSHAASENPQGSQQIVVDGQFFAGTGYELDGTDNQDPILGIIVVNPTLDSVAEAKITTQNYDAQFGKAVSSVVATQTKSGSNSVHGGVYDYRQSDAFQAKNPFNTPDSNTGRIVPANLRNQFGAFIGGPFQKDQFFYFFDYEGVRSKVGTSNGQSTVPTNLLRTSCLGPVGCDFSDYASYNGNNGIFDPVTGQQYANYIIPKAQINQAALNLLEKLPAPILGSVVANFPNSGTGKFNFDQYITRVDMQITEKVHGFGRYAYYKDTLQGGTAFGALGGIGFGTSGFGGTSNGINQSWSVGTDIVVSPKWVTDVRFGFLRYSINTQKYDGSEAFATNNGIPGLNVSNFANTGGAPLFEPQDLPNNGQGQPGGAFGAGLDANRCNCPLTQNERQYQFVNNWTHELGNHSIKFGVDVRHAYNLRVPSDANRAGVLYFRADHTSNPANNLGGLSYATFLLGRVSQFNRYASTSNNASETQNRFFGYIQDTWRVTPKLTLNYGLRWENYLPEKLGQDLGALLNLNTGNLQVAHEGPYGGDMGISNNNKAFAPRVGIAYAMNQKTVIRAGYGRSYDIGVFGSIFGHSASQNLPVLAKQNVSSPNSGYAFILGQAPPAPNFGGPIVNGNIRLPDGINANARPLTERFPTLDAWNAQVQRDLGHSYSLTLGYVGNKGTHTSMGGGYTSNPNQVAVVANGLVFNPQPSNVFQPSPNTQCIGAPSPNLPCSNGNDPRRRRYYPAYGWTQDINYFSSEGDTEYQSFQTTLDKRFSNGYQFKVNYAYQVAKDHDSDYIDIDRTVNYGNSSFLRRSQLTFFGNLELPFGRNHAFLSNANKIEDLIVGGWQISPTANIASGLPFDVGFTTAGRNRDAGPGRPNYNGGFKTGLGKFDAVNKVQTFYQPQTIGTVFTDPGYLHFGNLQRNAFFGPGFYNMDVAAQKNFHITERFSGQFRTDFFNVLNHQNFDLPSQTTVGSGTDGRITGLAPGSNPRYLQFAVKVLF